MKQRKVLDIIVIVTMVILLGLLCIYHVKNNQSIKDQIMSENNSNTVTTNEEKQSRIICIGDSQTVLNSSYPTYLKDLTSQKVITIGGEKLTSKDIAARLNAYALYVKNLNIPGDKTDTVIQVYNNNGSLSDLLRDYTSFIPTCSIDGIKGTIQYNGSQYIFKRDKSGKAHSITENTRIVFDKQDITSDDIVILNMGNYDKYNSYYTENLITFYQSIINEYKLNHYIIIGMVTKENSEDINKELKKKFKNHFFDMRDYLLNDYDKLSSSEKEELKHNQLPKALKEDDINGNSTYNQLLANQLIKVIKTNNK